MYGRGWCWCCVLWCAVAVAAAAEGEAELFAAPASFELDSTVQLNDVSRADKEVGYKIRATLHLTPLWSQHQTDYLLQFQLQSPKLYLRGKHVNADYMPYDSVWDSYSDTTFYAYWSNGLINKAYLDPGELPDVLNYKKSLLSLFQFQTVAGEYNETDISGPCLVLYETVSEQVFRKIKRSCSGDSPAGVVSSRRVSRYTLGERRQLHALHADELLALGHAQLGLKARSLHTLRRAPAGGLQAAPAPAGGLQAAPAPAGGLQAALAALPAALRELPLAAEVGAEPEEDEQELGAALAEHGAALADEAAGAGGGGEAAAAVLHLLPPLRAANHSALLQLLQRDDMHDALPGLCRLLGLAGTAGAHAAAADFLQLGGRDPLLPLAQHYLAALALAPAPQPPVVRAALRLAAAARQPALADAALLAAAAAAAAAADAELAQAVRDSIARGLARCKDEACRAVHLHALGNLRRADTADLLLEHAARRGADGAGAAALAALDALGALPARALTFARLERLEALALDERAALEVRAAALELSVRRRAELPAPLARVAYELHARGPHELRRLLWQRMAALAPQHEALRALPAMLEPVLRGWDAQAHSGTSTVLVRSTGAAVAGWRSQLDSVTLAQDALLRRATVSLLADHDDYGVFDILTVQVWTRGLEAFGGSGGDARGEAAAGSRAGGGLAIAVGGTRVRDVSLFDGQAELLGHVWAGTASADTAVLRAARPLAERRGGAALQGGAVLRVRWRAAAALALDARAQASLWWRSARAGLALRAGGAAAAGARVRTAWGRLAGAARASAAPRLRLAADLDFYDAVALCVRPAAEEFALRRDVTLSSELGARRLRVRRERRTAAVTPGRTLALGRPNDVTCRTLRAADEDEPA